MADAIILQLKMRSKRISFKSPKPILTFLSTCLILYLTLEILVTYQQKEEKGKQKHPCEKILPKIFKDMPLFPSSFTTIYLCKILTSTYFYPTEMSSQMDTVTGT